MQTGAHVTIFARGQRPLDEARDEILAARLSTNQEVEAVSLDLADTYKVPHPTQLESFYVVRCQI